MALTREQVIRVFRNMAAAIEENERYLNELDSTIGDAEHGLNLKRGFSILVEKVDTLGDLEPAQMIKRLGRILAGAGCGSGPIFFGLAIAAAGDSFAKNGWDTAEQVAVGLEAALQAIKEKGGADVGHKTMVDALDPAVRAFRGKADQGASVLEALGAAVAAAEEGARSTADMVGRKGRGFHAGERGVGHQDPGATSAYLLLKNLYETLKTL